MSSKRFVLVANNFCRIAMRLLPLPTTHHSISPKTSASRFFQQSRTPATTLVDLPISGIHQCSSLNTALLSSAGFRSPLPASAQSRRRNSTMSAALMEEDDPQSTQADARSWPVPRLRLQQMRVGSQTVSLVQPCDEDEVLDMYIARGEKERDPYWCTVWPAATALFQFVVRHPELVRGKRVCDLGAGLGLAGVAAILAGAREVMFLDREPLALLCALLTAHANVEPGCLSSNLESVASDCGLSSLLHNVGVQTSNSTTEEKQECARSEAVARLVMRALVERRGGSALEPAKDISEDSSWSSSGALSSLPSSTSPSLADSSSSSSLSDPGTEPWPPSAQKPGQAEVFLQQDDSVEPGPSKVQAESQADTADTESDDETDAPTQYHCSLLVYSPGDGSEQNREGALEGSSLTQGGTGGSTVSGRSAVQVVQAQDFDWSKGPNPGTFDVVLASDVLYEESAAQLLSSLLPALVTPRQSSGACEGSGAEGASGAEEGPMPCVVISDPTERCPGHRRRFLELIAQSKEAAQSRGGSAEIPQQNTNVQLNLLGQGRYRVSWRDGGNFRKSYIECMQLGQQ